MGAGAPSPVHYGRAVGDWQIGARYAVRGDLHLHHAGGETPAQVAVWRYRGTQPLPRFLEALAADVDAWSRLRHGNLAPLLDVGRIQGELTCYWVHEASGQRVLTDVLENVDVLDPTRAMHIALQLAHALVEVHRGGLVHGDLDPGNVGLLGTNDRVRLSWGGLAPRIEAAGMDTGRGSTRSASEIAPEVPTGHLTPAADIYGLAALLHRMLVGRPPFDGSASEPPGLEARDRLTNLPSYVPPDLASLLAHSLRRNPASRPPLHDFVNVLIDVERRMTHLGSPDSTADSVASAPRPSHAAVPPRSVAPPHHAGYAPHDLAAGHGTLPPPIHPAHPSPPSTHSGRSLGDLPPPAYPPGTPGHPHAPAHHSYASHYPAGHPTGPGHPGSGHHPTPGHLHAPGHVVAMQSGNPQIISAQSMTQPPPPPLFTPSREPAPPRAYDPSLGNHPSSYSQTGAPPMRTVQPSLAPPNSYQVVATHPPGYQPRRRSILSTMLVGTSVALLVLVLVAASAAVFDANRDDMGIATLFGASPVAAAPVEATPRPPAAAPVPVEPSFTLYSNPPRANVLENGEVIGVTPLRLPMEEALGTRTLTLQLDGYAAAEVVQEYVEGTPVQHVHLTSLGGPEPAPTARTSKAPAPTAATPAPAPRRRRRPRPQPVATAAAPTPPSAPPAAPEPTDEVGPSTPPTGLRTTRSPGQTGE